MPLWIRICLPEKHLLAQSLTLLPYSLPICAEVRPLFVNCCCYPHPQQDRKEKKKTWSGDKSKEKPWKKFLFLFFNFYSSFILLSVGFLNATLWDIQLILIHILWTVSVSPFLFLSLDFWHINKEHCPGFNWTEKFK